MFIVKVLQSGLEISSFRLESGHTYFIGRGSDCDIVLNNEAGISRKHVQVKEEGGVWYLELVARYGSIIHEGESKTSVVIDDEMILQVPPFEIRIEAGTRQATSTQYEGADSTQQQTFTEAVSPQSKNLPVPQANPGDNYPAPPDVEGNLENTAEIEVPLETILHVKLPDGKEEIIRLEGSSWIVGRDKNAEIPIRYDYLSKEHFEITRTDQGEFFITDLGSSNGTKVNKRPLEPDNPLQIQSGDTISVKKLRFKLKVKDSEFNRKLDHIIEDEMNLPMVQGYQPPQVGQPMPPAYMGGGYQAVVPYDENAGDEFSFLKPMTYKNNKPKAAIFLTIVVALLYFLTSEPEQKVTPEAGEKNENSKYTNLNSEQKDLINNSLDLAKNHLKNGSFTLCLTELDKIHKIIPEYNESKKLKIICRNGRELKEKNMKRRQLEEQAAIAKEKIKRIVADCTELFNSFKNMQELDQCLFEATELDPGAAGIEELKNRMTQKEVSKQQQAQQAAARQQRIAEGKRKFNTAESTYQQGKLARSIKQYERFLAGGYPDPSGLKGKAQRRLASIKQQLNVKVSKLLNECRRNLDEENYKDSYKACVSALEEDPSNEEAADLKQEVRTKLTKKMKDIYDNASIEENYGNIDAAKELWLKIKKIDFKGGSPFYSKATKKLRKYGF